MLKQKSAIGNNIKKYQNKLGIFQDALSRRKNLAFHAIVKIEAGSTPDPIIETVTKIADALNMSLDDLYPMKYGEAAARAILQGEKAWTGNYIFENEWQSFRTKKDRTIELKSIFHECGKGRRKIAVKVVDIFGNDTMKIVEV